MRKKDFKTSNKIIAYEESNPRIPRKKGQPEGSRNILICIQTKILKGLYMV